jgi:hypothetical protein
LEPQVKAMPQKRNKWRDYVDKHVVDFDSDGEVAESTQDERKAYLARRDGQDVPVPVSETAITVASVACASDSSAVVDNHVNKNSNIYYSAFFNDISNNFKIASEVNLDNSVAYLGSSTTVDLLTLMHNRTGHGNLRMLIEASKSKLVDGLKIEDKHIRKFI